MRKCGLNRLNQPLIKHLILSIYLSIQSYFLMCALDPPCRISSNSLFRERRSPAPTSPPPTTYTVHSASEIRLCMGSIDLMDLKRLDPINESAALRQCPCRWRPNLACKLNPAAICLPV